MASRSPVPRLVLACASLALGLLGPPARAVVELPEDTEATFAWTEADGPVLLYGVFVSRDGAPFGEEPELLVPSNRATLAGAPGETLSLRVAAYDVFGRRGPFSPPSEPVRFGPAPAPATPPPVRPLRRPGTRVGDRLDVDADGTEDLLFSDFAATALRALPMEAGRARPGRDLYALGWLGFELEGAGDFDGDGRTDLLWRRRETGRLTFALRRDGASEFRSTFALPLATELVAIGDFGGDGREDLVWRTPDGRLWVLHLEGAAVRRVDLLPALPAGTALLRADDLDGDGDADLLLRDPEIGATEAWILAAGVLAEVRPLPDPGPTFLLLPPADFDGDGDLDLAWYDGAGLRLRLDLLADGSPVGSRWLPAPEAGWWPAGTGDYDGDGRGDLLWRHPSLRLAMTWLLDGTALRGGRVFAVPAPPADLEIGR